jgi:hypothetical protein
MRRSSVLLWGEVSLRAPTGQAVAYRHVTGALRRIHPWFPAPARRPSGELLGGSGSVTILSRHSPREAAHLMSEH